MSLSINIRILETRRLGGRKLHDLRKRQLGLEIEINPYARHDADAQPEPIGLHSGERDGAAEPPSVGRDIAHGVAHHDEVGRYRAIRILRHRRGEIETWRASPSPTLAVDT